MSPCSSTYRTSGSRPAIRGAGSRSPARTRLGRQPGQGPVDRPHLVELVGHQPRCPPSAVGASSVWSTTRPCRAACRLLLPEGVHLLGRVEPVLLAADLDVPGRQLAVLRLGEERRQGHARGAPGRSSDPSSSVEDRPSGRRGGRSRSARLAGRDRGVVPSSPRRFSSPVISSAVCMKRTFFFCVTLNSGGRATKMCPSSISLPHLAVEERQQQRADVLAVHVGVGQDDDLAVAQPARCPRSLPMSTPMAAIRLAISLLSSSFSSRAFSTLSTLPRSGRIAW